MQLLCLEEDLPDTGFKETPRPFPIKSNRRATFDTVPGSMTGFGGTRPGTGSQRGFRIDPAKDAAMKRYSESKKSL